MNIMKKLYHWLAQCAQPVEAVDTDLSEPEANLQKAIRLMHDIKRREKQWSDYSRDTQRWAAWNDCSPLPRTERENQKLAALAQGIRDAYGAWNSWMGEGRAFPPRSQWPEDFSKWAK